YLNNMYKQNIPELESARTYGILGIILQFVGTGANILTNGLGFIISIIGLILLFLSLKSISNYYGNQKPFKYMLYSLISGIVLGTISAIVIILLLLPVAFTTTTGPPNAISRISVSAIGMIFLTLFLVVMAVLVSVIFEYLAYNSVYELTGIDDFHTGALLLLIGVIFTVILVGIILILIGIILLIISFNKLPTEAKPVVIDQDAAQNQGDGMI
ncbi:DUF996 domain-containing protein, partial [Ferroplasma sp. Type II]|uniref:DUF996 domain-containing protein n=1 Tax=Ferroplasma sp. Type II TaxID=261388 RepID=UPI0025BBADC6